MSDRLPEELRVRADLLIRSADAIEAERARIAQIEARHAAEKAAWDAERAELRGRIAALAGQLRDEERRTAAEAARTWACKQKLLTYGITA